MSSSTPPAPGTDQPAGPPIPPGYKPGDYIPFADRDPSNPSSIAGQWADPARQAQMHGQQAGRALTPQEQYRAIYGLRRARRGSSTPRGAGGCSANVVDTFLLRGRSIPLLIGCWTLTTSSSTRPTRYGNETIADGTDVSTAADRRSCVVGASSHGLLALERRFIRQGRTGYTLGKTVVGIRLVERHDGRADRGRAVLRAPARARTSTAWSATWAGSGRCGTAGTRRSPTRS